MRQALTVLGRFPGFALGAGAVETRLAAIVGGGRSTDYTTQIAPWLGGEVALALLNTAHLDRGLADRAGRPRPRPRAAAFVRGQGAAVRGPSYRGTELLGLSDGL